MSELFLKDPNEKLDYEEDWSDWLGDDTITGTPVYTVPTGLTNFETSNNTTTTTIWLTGGTHGQEYIVSVKVTTTGGRIGERSIKIIVRNR